MSTNNKNTLLIYIALTFIMSSYLSAQGILNTSTTYLVANNGVNIVINNGGFTNNGTYTKSTSSLVFTGTNATSASFIAGSSSTDLYNLTVNKSSNGVQLNRNIGVSNILLFTSGDSLFLNNHTIDLGTTGSLSGETGTKRITGLTGGYIQRTVDLNAPFAINAGNIGIAITSNENLGATIIKRGHQQQSGASIFRYFDISPANNTGLAAAIDFYYFDQELAAVPEANLGVFSSVDGGSHWTNLGEDDINMSTNIITVGGIDSFYRLTLSDFGAPLAATLLYLKGNLINKQTVLNWATVSETENYRFDIERSFDGVRFSPIGSVAGAGNSASIQQYQFIDEYPQTGKNYYRLKMYDYSNKFNYSAIVAVTTGVQDTKLVNAFPNPTANNVNISFVADQNQQYQIQVRSINGRILQTKMINCTKGYNQFAIDLSTVPSGIYSVVLLNSTYKSVQIIKL